MPNVVVTGAAGFIGSHLVQRLADDGHSVTVVVRRREQAARLARPGVTPHLADVADPRSLEAPLACAEVVFHLAGRIHASSLAEFRAVNAAGVRNVARVCARADSPPTLVVVSSLAAAGPSPVGQPRMESDPPAPVSQYGLSKLEGEQAAGEFAADVPISIVRPPFVFGGGDRASLPLFRMIRRWGLQVVPRGHDPELSLIHVEDLVEAILAVAERGRRIGRPLQRPVAAELASVAAGPTSGTETPHVHSVALHAVAPHPVDLRDEDLREEDQDRCIGIYSPADEQLVTYTEMGRLIGRCLERRVRVWRVRRPWLWGACAVAAGLARITGRPGVINFDKLREATAPAWTCSNQRSRDELGFSPSAPLEARLAETADWYEQAGWL